MSDDVVRINTGVSMSLNGAEKRDIVEIPRAEWDAMTDAEREERLSEIAQNVLDNEVDAWAYVEDEGSDGDE